MLPENVIRIHGPYEDAIIAVTELIGKIQDGQDPATKKELWTRYLEETKPFHELAVKANESVMGWLEKIFK